MKTELCYMIEPFAKQNKIPNGMYRVYRDDSLLEAQGKVQQQTNKIWQRIIKHYIEIKRHEEKYSLKCEILCRTKAKPKIIKLVTYSAKKKMNPKKFNTKQKK